MSFMLGDDNLAYSESIVTASVGAIFACGEVYGRRFVAWLMKWAKICWPLQTKRKLGTLDFSSDPRLVDLFGNEMSWSV